MSKKCNFAVSTERVGIEGYGIFVLVAYTMETNQSNVSEGT